MSELPLGWTEVALADIADVQLGKMLDTKRTEGTRIPYLRNVNVQWERIDTQDLLSMPFKDGERERYAVLPGDVLVCEGGEPGRAATWNRPASEIMYQKALHRVRLPAEIPSAWLVHQLRLDAFNGVLSEGMTGSTISHLPLEVFRRYRLRIAPASEQTAILGALDSYNSRLDATTAALERVERNLRRYRASLLRAAVEGNLVLTEAELSRRNGHTLEPASSLLARIWSGKRETEEQTSIRVALADESKSLPELPEGWCWSHIGQIADISGGLTKNPRRETLPSRVPYLRVANVYADELRLENISDIGVADGELQRVLLQRDDLLIVEGNGSPDQIGRVALWDGSISRCAHQNHIIKARFADPSMARWALVWLSSLDGRAAINRVASSTSGLHTLSISKIAALPIPIPPLAEQHRITLEVSRQQSILSTAAAAVARDLSRVRAIRRAVLRAAFRGELA